MTTTQPKTSRKGRPRIGDQVREAIRKLAGQGRSDAELAELFGVSKRSVQNIRREGGVSAAAGEGPVVVASPVADGGDAIDLEVDLDGDPLAIARGLLSHATNTIGALPSDSPRLNPARAEARALVQLVAKLEREHARDETTEERERRLRLEDRETERRVMVYVEQWEKEARRPTPEAPFGRCVHCEAALTEEKAVELYGDAP